MQDNNISSSLTKGVTFCFEHNGNQIKTVASCLTGKESIYVNDKLVSKRFNVGFKSIHEFSISGSQYEIEYEVENFITYRVRCTLIKDGTHIETKRFGFNHNRREYLKILAIAFALGAVSGFVGIAVAQFLAGQ